jgi:molybdopterin-guanine dinucleotide biosynthesis protein A
MGTDKAWLEIWGVPMIERVLSTIQPLASQTQICLGAVIDPIDNRYLELARTWNALIAFDKAPGQGPLGGILTALEDARLSTRGTVGGDDAVVLVVACDMPLITTSFIELLLKKHEAGRPDITVPCDADGRVHPLCAIYSVSCLSAVESSLREERLRVDSVFDRVETSRFEYPEYEHLKGSRRFLTNVNTRSTLYRLQAEVTTRARDSA